jgi:hypothetical protein
MLDNRLINFIGQLNLLEVALDPKYAKDFFKQLFDVEPVFIENK